MASAVGTLLEVDGKKLPFTNGSFVAVGDEIHFHRMNPKPLKNFEFKVGGPVSISFQDVKMGMDTTLMVIESSQHRYVIDLSGRGAGAHFREMRGKLYHFCGMAEGAEGGEDLNQFKVKFEKEREKRAAEAAAKNAAREKREAELAAMPPWQRHLSQHWWKYALAIVALWLLISSGK